MLDERLTHSHHAEQGLLSSMLQMPEECFEAIQSQGVTDTWFINPIHMTIFQGLCKMRKDGKKIDVISATDFFYRNGEKFPVPEPGVLITDIYTFVASGSHYSQYIEILRECYAQRLGILACKEAEEQIKQATSLQEIFNATSGIFTRTHEVCEQHEEKDWDKEAMNDFINKMEALQSGKLQNHLIKTSIPTLNEEVGGLAPGELTIITGLPSTGKSILGNNIVRHAGLEQGKRSMIFSMEMPTDQLIRRLVADIGEINMSSMRQESKLTEGEMKRFMSTVTRISKANIAFRDSKSVIMSMDGIEAAIRKHKKNKGLDLALIDYLQLIKTKSQKDKRRDEELSEISGQLKRIAQELDLAIILIAAENKEGGIRGSQGCEFDADSILRMVPIKNKDGRVESTSGIYVEKCREGRRGYTIPVTLDGQHQRIIETTI